MKLSTYTNNDISIKYAWLPAKTHSKYMIVVLTNMLAAEGSVDFVFNLAPFTNINKLFIASCEDYKYGLYLMKNNEFVVRDAIIQLIDNYRNDVERSNLYIIGYCASSLPAVYLAVHQGCNAVISRFMFGGFLTTIWSDDDPEKSIFMEKYLKYLDSINADPPSYINKKFAEYTGRADFHKIITEQFDYYKEIEPNKFKIPKLYFHAGKHEETWKLKGEETCLKLDSYGIKYDLTIDEEYYNHIHSLNYVSDYIKKIISENCV